MKKAFAVAALVGALALTGCTSTALHGTTPQDQPATPVEVTPEPAPVAVPASTADTVFYGSIDAVPELVGSEAEAKSLAKAFCGLAATTDFTRAYEAGLSYATSQGMSAYNFGYIVGAGVPVYCPQQRQAMTDYIGGQ